MRCARFQLAAALLLAAVVLASGCGDDDDEPASQRPQTAQTEPPAATAEETATTEATDTAQTETEDDAEAGADELPDTCQLLSAAEMRAATGRDVDPMEEKGDTIDGFSYRQCNWTAVGFEDSAAVRVVSGTRRYDTLKRDLGGAGARITDVSGLGDAAFFASGFSGETAGGTRGSTLFVKADGKTFSLALANEQDEGPQEELESLMRKMLEGAD